MNYTVEKYQQFRDLVTKHNLNLDNEFCFLPENLKDANKTSDFIYSEESTEIKKIFKEDGILIGYLNNEKPLLRSRKSADWFGPAIFVGFYTLINNPQVISVGLNILSNYLYDFFKGTIGDKKVKFEIIIENRKDEEYQKINYEGSIEGILELENVIKALKNDNPVH